MEKRKTRRQVCSLAVTALLAAMLGIYLLSILCINFSIRPSFYVADMYADIMVSVKMWEQKTLLPENWIFGNQLYVLATPVLSALIYGITGDPFRAMAAASSAMTVLVLVSFDWMLKAVFSRPAERLFGMVSFLFVVVLFGDAVWTTNGWQLFFTMCSYYACYAVNAFLAFGCYLRSNEKNSWITIAAVCVLSFAMGIQSLRQTVVMVLPLMALELFRMIRRMRQHEPILSGSFAVAAAVSASNLMGVVLKRFLNVNQTEIFGQINLRALGDIPGALWKGLKDACALLFYFEEEPVLPYLLGLTLFVLAALILFFRTRHQTSEAVKTLFALFLLSVLSFLGIAAVTTMRVRSIYYFMLYPFLACLAVYVFANRRKAVKYGMVVLLCAGFCVSCVIQVIPACKWAYNKAYDYNYEISDQLLNSGYTTVYSRWDGCSQIAIASYGKIKAGFWRYSEEPFVPASFLCDPEVFTAEPEQAAYVFCSEEEVECGIQKAGKANIALIPVVEYPERDIYIYTAPVNLTQLFLPET